MWATFRVSLVVVLLVASLSVGAGPANAAVQGQSSNPPNATWCWMEDLYAQQSPPGHVWAGRWSAGCTAPANFSMNVVMCRIEPSGCSLIVLDSVSPATGCGMVSTCSVSIDIGGLMRAYYQICSAASFNGGPGYTEYAFPYQCLFISVSQGPESPAP